MHSKKGEHVVNFWLGFVWRIVWVWSDCQKRFSWFSDWNPKVQKRVNLVYLVTSFQTSSYLQNLASIQPRTGFSKFAKN